jgi:DNA polymerase V
MEVYSIDECFLDFSGMPQDLSAYALDITKTVKQWTGIPVSIGIGPTKTLAKISNRLAKKGFNPCCPVLDWSSLPSPEATLAALPVEDVWGISSRWGEKLRALGMEDAGALRQASPNWLRQRFGVVMERIGWELRGAACPACRWKPCRLHASKSWPRVALARS